LRLELTPPQEKVPTCGSEFHAANAAHSRGEGEGLSVTGVGGVSCARHMFVMRLGDLHRGERYRDHVFWASHMLTRCRFVNMDYILFDALKNRKYKYLMVTYDIWCKYYVNLQRRSATFASSFVGAFPKAVVQGYVPKFHLPAHGSTCRTIWSLNFAPNVGRTDSEGPERIWAIEGLLATQTAEMGPGNRHAVLDDHVGEGNYRRYIGLRKLTPELIVIILINGHR
jgi:hypothetical protein